MSIYEQNPYQILGLKDNAGSDEIRKAYLKLATKYHPDRNQGDPAAEERFKAISLAYAILSDPATGAAYEKDQRIRRASQERAAKHNSAQQKTTGPKAKAADGNKQHNNADSNAYNKHHSNAGQQSRTYRDRYSTNNNDSAQDSFNQTKNEKSFEEILAKFFTSAKGQATLDQLKKELEKSGFKLNSQDFTQWFNEPKKNNISINCKNKSWKFIKNIFSKLKGKKEAERKGAYDIKYRLPLNPQAAQSGTTIEISYRRDNGSTHQKLAVRIPANAYDGMNLRLSGQGRLKPNHSRGDLILTINVVF